MKTKNFDDILLKVRRGTWRETILRLIRAEQEVELLKDGLDSANRLFDAARQLGQNDVLNLIKRWGKCRPLEGYNGEQMAEALRKVVTPTIAPYDDYKGITEALTEESVKTTDDGFVRTSRSEDIVNAEGEVTGSRTVVTYAKKNQITPGDGPIEKPYGFLRK